MMWTGKAPVQDYPYALRHWIYLQDMLPNGTTRVSPYEKRVGIPPKLKPGMVEAPLFCTESVRAFTGKNGWTYHGHNVRSGHITDIYCGHIMDIMSKY